MIKVLVVDNHDEILDVMENLLKPHDYHVMVASSYKTILPIIYKDKPDIIILDVMLHSEDGRIICQQLKENDRTKDICIILFSASPHKLKDFSQYKADGKLEKPFDLKDLIAILKSCEKKKLNNSVV